MSKVATDLVKLRKKQESYRLLVSVFLGAFVIGEGASLLTLQSRRKGSFQESRVYVNSSLQALFLLIRSFYQASFF